MSLYKLKVQDLKIGTFRISKEQLIAENERYEYLKNKASIHNRNIDILKNNFHKYKNAQDEMTNQYNLLKVAENELYKDIFQVGKTKALGYLPESYFESTNRDLNYFIEYAINKNLSFYITDNGYGGRIIAVYDKKLVNSLLSNNQDILIKNNLSLDTDDFVRFIIDGKRVNYDTNTELFVLVAMAFNDKRLERIA